MRNWLIAVLGVSACGGDESSEPNVPVATVTVTPLTSNIRVGGAVQLQVTTLDGSGGTLTGRQITWTTGDAAIATVSPSGNVTGIAEGDVTITATSEMKTGAAAVTVQDPDPGPQPLVGGLRAGANSTCATVENGGGVFCWGANEFGQVGDGTTTDRLRPTGVGAPLYSPPYPGDHVCATDNNGLYCWGRNVSGEVGVGTTDPAPTPSLVSGGLAFQQVVIGDDFTCGQANSGATYCWGANDVGQLGTGVAGNSSVPVPVAGDPQFRVLAAAGRTACGATVTGELLCWGNGADGELGNGQFDVISTTPMPVGGGFQWEGVAIGANAAGEATVCAGTITALYCWGKNSDGEIGDGTKQRRSLPTAVVGVSPNAQIAPGGSHTCARLPQATVVCWGKAGRLGNGTSQASLTPVAVAGGLVFAAIWSGRDHTCGRTDDEPSRAYCWGDNARGQLGDGTMTERLVPTRVVF
jgi:alpha-tubulin suppressor-like RCC1 family protein